LQIGTVFSDAMPYVACMEFDALARMAIKKRHMPFGLRKKQRMLPFAGAASSGLVDLHNHVLFGVDDGAHSVAESVAMLEGLARLGYTDVAVSPHFDADSGEPRIHRQLEIISAIDAAQADIVLPRLYPGAEILLDERFFDPVHDSMWPPIGGKGSSYLVELGMYPGAVPVRLEEHVFRLCARGLTLVLAHPERMADMQRDRERLQGLRSAGMLLQLDAMALVGRYGRKAQDFASLVIEDDGYDLVASDIHKPDDIALLERALLHLSDNYRDSFERLTSLAPRLVLEGRGDEIG
jgi:protein-tyrosine phosphatase